MLTWLQTNIGTICVLLVVILAIVFAIAAVIRDRRNGSSGCGCGCQGCAMRDSCHKKQDSTK